MFRWVKMYWLLLRNKSDTVDYIKKHKTAITYVPIIWFEVFYILDLIFKFRNGIFKPLIIIIYILLALNIFVCNRIVSANEKVIKQKKLEKEKEKLEDKARNLLIKIVNLMQQLDYSMSDINNYYKTYTDKINLACKYFNSKEHLTIVSFDSIIMELEFRLSDLKFDLDYAKQKKQEEEDYNTYKQWRKNHNSCNTYNEVNWWNKFEKRYQREFGRQQYHNFYEQGYYSNPFNNSTSDKDKYLKTLELPIDTDDFNIIKKQYIKLIKKYHPDISHDNGEKAKEINIAYQELEKILK